MNTKFLFSSMCCAILCGGAKATVVHIPTAESFLSGAVRFTKLHQVSGVAIYQTSQTTQLPQGNFSVDITFQVSCLPGSTSPASLEVRALPEGTTGYFIPEGHSHSPGSQNITVQYDCNNNKMDPILAPLFPEEQEARITSCSATVRGTVPTQNGRPWSARVDEEGRTYLVNDPSNPRQLP